MAGLIPGIVAGATKAFGGGTAGESFREAAFAGLPGFSETALTSAQFNKLQEESRTIRGERERSNRIVTTDSITQGLGSTAKRKMIDTLRREGILTEDGTGVRAGDLQSRQDKFLDEPEEIIEFAQDNIIDIDKDLKNATAIRDDAVVKEAKKLVSSQVKLGNIPKGSEEIAEQAAVKELQADPAFNQEVNRLNGRRQQFMEQIELQKDMIRKFKETDADTLAGITPSTREIIRAEKDPRIKAALEEKQQQKIEVAQAQRTAIIEATQEADLNKVLPPDQIVKFINRDTGTPAEFGMTNRDLIEGDFVPVTTAQKGSIAALGSADNIINTMQPIVDRLFTAGGFVSRVGETAGVIFQREFLGETDAVFYEALKEGVIGQFVKIVGGESGSRLSDQDIKRMRGLFPAMHAGIFGLIDTRETAKRKMRFLIENMEKLRSDILSKVGITPVGTLAEKLAETLPELPRQDIGTMSNGDILNQLGAPVGVPKKKVDDSFRPDGTRKGTGFLGGLRMKDGKIATELSIDVEIDGQKLLIPMLVPTLTQDEVDSLLNNEEPTKEIIDKAVSHALERIRKGLNPFAEQA